MSKRMILRVARYLVGALFIFSGLIKVNDPIGTAIKLEEYFEVFASDFGSFFMIFVPLSLFLAVFLSVLEIILGIALFINYRMQVTSFVLLGLIVFFTFLTFYSAYFDKVTDCGCFGDAIPLNPWQSFIKDLILLAFILVLVFYRDRLFPKYSEKISLITLGMYTLLATIIAISAIRNLPFVDFRAYKVGNDIGALMEPSEPLRYEYIMEKDGKTYRFEQYPSEEGYTYKDMKLLNPKAEPKITDFSVWDDEGEYTEEMLSGNKLWVVIPYTAKASFKNMEEISSLLAALGPDIRPALLTATSGDTFEQFRHETQLAAPFYFVDATVLKTIIRSSPGLVLLKDGIVLGKWHHNNTPSVQELKELIQAD